MNAAADPGPPEAPSSSQVTREPSALERPIAHLRPGDPLRWLRAGWADFRRCPGIGLFYGACFCAMGHALLGVFQAAPAYVLALSAGFLLMGPFLCLGLYDASRALQRGETPSLGRSLRAWVPTKGSMALFAGVLLVLEMLWGRASLVVFAVSFTTLPDAQNLVAQMLRGQHLEFLITWTLVGAVFAGLIFVTSVVSIPMILDRGADAISAGLTSIRACLQNPGVMLFWGLLISAIVALSMLPWFLGLLVSGPVIGHASWHAYRATVAPGGPTPKN
jgi:uncharacterized membrane protein